MMEARTEPDEYVRTLGPLFPGKIIHIPDDMTLMEVSGALTKRLQEQNSGSLPPKRLEKTAGCTSSTPTTSSQG